MKASIIAIILSQTTALPVNLLKPVDQVDTNANPRLAVDLHVDPITGLPDKIMQIMDEIEGNKTQSIMPAQSIMPDVVEGGLEDEVPSFARGPPPMPLFTEALEEQELSEEEESEQENEHGEFAVNFAFDEFSDKHHPSSRAQSNKLENVLNSEVRSTRKIEKVAGDLNKALDKLASISMNTELTSAVEKLQEITDKVEQKSDQEFEHIKPKPKQAKQLVKEAIKQLVRPCV